MLHINELTYRIEGRIIFDRAAAGIPAGHKVGLVGRNGAGKTTLLRLIAGELAPDDGGISVPRATRIGWVAQEAPGGPDSLINFVLAADRERARLLAEAETAQDPARIADIHQRLVDIGAYAAPAKAARILAGLGFDAAAQQRACAEFSGGWRTRVALAAVLFTEPDLLLLDEPTAGIDPVSRREFWQILNELHHDGLTIVVATQHMDEAQYATRLAFLQQGRLLDVGTLAEILARYPRALVEVRSDDRSTVRTRLTRLPEIDDVSLFGTALHVRGRDNRSSLADDVRDALDGIVAPDAVFPIPPSIEDVFILRGESLGEVGA
jgi:ABC-type multidrug transport system ATPase subunit